MTQIRGWQWIPALAGGLIFFVLFSAGYGLFVYVRPQRILSDFTPQDFGYDFQNVSLVTADGLRLAGWWVPASRGSAKAILLLHGYPADKGDILQSMLFLQADYNLLFLDFRYFGGSAGTYSTVGIKEVEDVLTAMNYLKAQGMEKIGIWGFSMGAAAALMSVPKAAPQSIDAVVSESSYASLSLMAEEVFRQLPGLNKAIAKVMAKAANLVLGIDIEEHSPLAALGEIQKPILLIHSKADKVIPFAHAELLQKAASGNPQAEFWFQEGEPHGYLGSPEYQERVGAFFQKHLQ